MITMKLTKIKMEIPRVKRKVETAKRKNMRRMGFLIMTTAKGSMKRRKGTASSGQPPNVHAKGINLKWIRYWYDFATGILVIGPVGFPNRTSDRPGGNIQEFGGRARFTSRKTKRKTAANISKHPFMGPALSQNISDGFVAKTWKDSIKQ